MSNIPEPDYYRGQKIDKEYIDATNKYRDLSEVIKDLEKYNDWRRGKDGAVKLTEGQIGVLINTTIMLLKDYEATK